MKTWMITGTSSGFGKALASKLAQEDGVSVIATARKEADLDYLDQYDHGQIKKSSLTCLIRKRSSGQLHKPWHFRQKSMSWSIMPVWAISQRLKKATCRKCATCLKLTSLAWPK
ncbi:hypothetical protein [Lactobacillus sp.]|uniref:hypothetical protein n=1 Tax=Lactobacillus sp. TaxID=1591 RepID=UPI003F122896